ncbi:MAG TPA: DUF3501 family protein [Polyangia bacterium]|nr:DUF3501 family protein [Polyangia bacterium]
MRHVQRSQILDRARYERTRSFSQTAVLEIKRKRRVHVGDCLTFLFENTTTIWYQIQEMIRAERIDREPDILHELATYNALLGGRGQLGCCLLIEIDDPVMRDRRLKEWRALPAYVYMRCEGGATVRPTVDPAQIDERRISAVQYLKFHLDDWRPISVGCDLPGLIAETTLSREQRDALNDDLRAAESINATVSATVSVGTGTQRVAVVHQERHDNFRRER